MISLKTDAVTRLNRNFLELNIQYIANEFETISLVKLTESHTGNYNKINIIRVVLYTI